MEIGLLMLGGGFVAGTFGSLLGLGGGVLIVPLLTIGFGLPVREAVAVSLISVVMTSGASAAVYLERDVANLRLGMFLELFTALGAVIGGGIAFVVDQQVVAALFALLMLYVAVTMARSALARPRASAPEPELAPEPDAPDLIPAVAVAAAGPAGPATTGPEKDDPGSSDFVGRLSRGADRVRHVRVASIASVFAGILSALLGVGGGIVKVPIMHLLMGVPLRVSTATSNLMIGITASTSAIVYLLRGGVDPFVAGPTAVGVFVGATIGSRSSHRVNLTVLRWLFVAVLLYTAYEMARLAVGLG